MPFRFPGRASLFLRAWLGASVVLSSIGLPVITDWHIAAWMPMQLNAAIGIFLCGIALFATGLKKTGAAHILGILLTFLGVATLAEYFFTVNLGIDELLRTGQAIGFRGFTGRMAPNTAAGFVLVGLAVILLNRKNRSPQILFVIGLISAWPAILGIVTAVSYGTNVIPSYGWGNYALMSLPTAIAFIAIGSLLVAAAVGALQTDYHDSGLHIFPLCLTLLLFSISIAFWQFFLGQDAEKLRSITEIQLAAAKIEATEMLDQYALALQRMATRLEHLGIGDKTLLTVDSRSYLEHLTGLTRIGLVNPQLQVTWSWPPELDQQVSGFNQGSDLTRKAAFDFARSQHRPALSEHIVLRSGGNGFLLPIAMFPKGKFTGYLYATLNVKNFFDKVLGYLGNPGYRIRLRERGQVVYENDVKPVRNEEKWGRTIPFNWGSARWELQMVPSKEVLQANQSNTHIIVLASGLLISLLNGFFFQFLLLSRKQKLQLIEKETTFQQIVENVREYAIFMLNPDGTVATWNAGAQRLIGWPESEIIGKHFSIFSSPEDFARTEHTRKLELITKTGKYEGEGWRFRKDGSRFWAHTVATRIESEKGELIGFSTVVRDRSERRQVEIKRQKEMHAALEGEHKATEASKIKSQFLANMSHEIRTPLNGVIGMTGLILDTKLDDEQRDYVENIKRSGELLLEIINDILDFSKVEAGKLELENIEFNLPQMVQDTVKTLGISAKQKGLQIQCEGMKSWPHAFIGDPGRIRQVLTNLLGNAIKFTPKGTIQVRIMETPLDSQTATVRFEVEDEGVGIPVPAIPRIFEAFSQAESSTSRRFGGTGLGLSICKKLVFLMGGTIDFTSVQGEGSLFWFELALKVGAPLSQPVLITDPVEPELSRKLLGKRVLVAEDNIVNQKVTRKQLEKLGIRVDVAANGHEVIAALKNAPYDLIFMDCQMPEMDGYEATRQIRADKEAPYHSIPIVALTADAIRTNQNLCLSAGMNDYLDKPVKIFQLKEKLEEWIKSTPIVEESLDISVLEELKNMDASIVREIAGLFLHDVPRRLQILRENYNTKNFAAIKIGAHTLKSSGGTVGAVKFYRLCTDLENLEFSEDPRRAESLIEELFTEFSEFRQALEAYLEKAAA